MTEKLIRSLQEAIAYAKGDSSQGRTSQHRTFDPLKIPEQIDLKELRQKLQMTQEEFSACYGFNLHTLRNWEHGRRHPDKAVLAYLYTISQNPLLVEEALRK